MEAKLKNDFRTVHVLAAQKYVELVAFKKEGNISSFNDLLMQLIPEIKKYVKGKLNSAEAKGLLDKNRYKSDDIIDQLYIEYYEHFDEVKEDTFLYAWLFKKADELINDILSEEEFDTYFYKNIDKFSKPEWDEMEEKYSTDGDGDFVMLDEFDNQEYSKNDYLLNHVFIDDADDEIIAALDKKLNKENVKKHSALVLQNFPKPMKKVFELSTAYKFTVPEIAKISNYSIKEVDVYLKNARKKLKSSFINRFNSNI